MIECIGFCFKYIGKGLRMVIDLEASLNLVYKAPSVIVPEGLIEPDAHKELVKKMIEGYTGLKVNKCGKLPGEKVDEGERHFYLVTLEKLTEEEEKELEKSLIFKPLEMFAVNVCTEQRQMFKALVKIMEKMEDFRKDHPMVSEIVKDQGV